MTSTFFGFNIARRGMSAHKAALDVTAHNIANASTAGYSRQQAIFQTTTPFNSASANKAAGAGQIGTGVQIGEIRRVRDSFLDFQLRPQLSKLGYWDEKYSSLSSVEMIMMEPSETGLSNIFERFWGAWQEVAKNPTSGATRAAVLETSATMASSLNSIAIQLETVVSDLNVKVDIAVKDMNSISTQLAALNKQIVANVGAGLNPNDLMDERDMLLDNLAELTNFTPIFQPNGSVDVSIKGRYLVQESRATLVQSKMVDGHVKVQWADEVDLGPSNGRIAGMYAVRDFIANDFSGKLNEMATTLMTEVNKLHKGGVPLSDGGINTGEFFVLSHPPTDNVLKFIRVNQELVDNPSYIRAAVDLGASTGLSQGENALAIARLRGAPIFNDGTTSIQAYYSGIINAVGVQSQQAERMVLNQEALTAQLVGRREDASGVSIDEELSYMIQFQHGYQAAAKLLTTIDEMLQTLINLGR
ncbi:MAG: flagellar hook-associated protein FlgK [Bacillota bacterium]|nr:flagellar hook-associated protein FlgK [Bacillota bacterium]